MKSNNITFAKSFILTGLFLFFLSACDKEKDNTGSPQNSEIVKTALSQAGITTYDGNTPPTITGMYTTTPMLCTSAKGDYLQQNFVGGYMNSIFKLFNQTSAGDISMTEKLPSGQWGSGNGCVITGSGMNFTIYMEMELSNGAATCFVLVGTLEQSTGNFINCRSITVFTRASANCAVGDWYTASGWIQSLNSVYGKWTTTTHGSNGHYFNWHMEFFVNASWTCSIYDATAGLQSYSTSGTWSKAGNAFTINEPANIHNGNVNRTNTGTYEIANDATLLTLTNLYIWSGQWSRE